ncbi:glycyl-tRNA synthetase [Catovirus CTV1]|uniref:glycine--tRNA ligase n=1 Tax=Catovirus CTV1 TaxID=1977631 RepID=A0A1V0SAN4_9VIRU|nr:glycyl-tRNA synthetase [Catovirus CTV1]
MQEQLKTHLEENQFIIPSSKLYGGVNGFHDYGTLGCIVKQKLVNLWRKHFLFEDEVYEVETSILTLPAILKTSGHLDRFFDYVVYDKEKKCYRADHIVKEHLKSKNVDSDEVDTWSKDKLEEYIKQNLCDQLNLDKNVSLQTKNLMFHADDMFLRPETCQHLFGNFDQYLSFYKEKLPFGVAQVGKSYRKEISPKPFTRLLEFTQAEIEFFFDPKVTTHQKFDTVKTLKVPLYSSRSQLDNTSVQYCTLEEAVNQKIICNQILAYYLGRIYLFSKLIGLREEMIRFRQHLPNEMAHYAADCWDFECMVDGNWLECIGCANRQDYDLKAHSVNKPLTVRRTNKVNKIQPVMKEIGKTFKTKSKILSNYLNKLNRTETDMIINHFQHNNEYILNIENEVFNLNKHMIEIESVYEEYHPHVIEPSFGIDRLIYSIFSQNFSVRTDDEQRIVLSLPKVLSPYEVAIIQLCNDDNIINMVNMIREKLKSNGLLCYTDYSGVTIGKRYVRTDKIGIKYAITVDYESLNDNTVTIRERDSMSQIRVKIDDILKSI